MNTSGLYLGVFATFVTDMYQITNLLDSDADICVDNRTSSLCPIESGAEIVVNSTIVPDATVRPGVVSYFPLLCKHTATKRTS